MEDELRDALAGEVEDWLASLPEYQRRVINQMLASKEPSDVALAWLTSSGPTDTAPFGTVRTGIGLFYDKLLGQIHALLCDRSQESEERSELLRNAAAGRAVLVTGISTAIAPHLGASPIFIAPAVALTLAVIGKAGGEAACETLSMMIAARQSRGEEPPAAPTSDESR